MNAYPKIETRPSLLKHVLLQFYSDISLSEKRINNLV